VPQGNAAQSNKAKPADTKNQNQISPSAHFTADGGCMAQAFAQKNKHSRATSKLKDMQGLNATAARHGQGAIKALDWHRLGE
jgi:hypothetical protein